MAIISCRVCLFSYKPAVALVTAFGKDKGWELLLRPIKLCGEAMPQLCLSQHFVSLCLSFCGHLGGWAGQSVVSWSHCWARHCRTCELEGTFEDRQLAQDSREVWAVLGSSMLGSLSLTFWLGVIVFFQELQKEFLLCDNNLIQSASLDTCTCWF